MVCFCVWLSPTQARTTRTGRASATWGARTSRTAAATGPRAARSTSATTTAATSTARTRRARATATATRTATAAATTRPCAAGAGPPARPRRPRPPRPGRRRRPATPAAGAGAAGRPAPRRATEGPVMSARVRGVRTSRGDAAFFFNRGPWSSMSGPENALTRVTPTRERGRKSSLPISV